MYCSYNVIVICIAPDLPCILPLENYAIKHLLYFVLYYIIQYGTVYV